MKRKPLADFLNEVEACFPSIKWAEKYGTDYECAWQECKRPDWMVWIITVLAKNKEDLDFLTKVLFVYARDKAKDKRYKLPEKTNSSLEQLLPIMERYLFGKGAQYTNLMSAFCEYQEAGYVDDLSFVLGFSRQYCMYRSMRQICNYIEYIEKNTRTKFHNIVGDSEYYVTQIAHSLADGYDNKNWFKQKACLNLCHYIRKYYPKTPRKHVKGVKING